MARFTSRQLFQYIKRYISRAAIHHWKASINHRHWDDNKTIYALSSGQGKAGIAVIRVSGPDAVQVVHRISNLKIPPKPRQATLTTFKDAETGEHLDKGILLWFPGPASFTGEECCELHVHGGTAVVSAIFTSLSKLGFRPSEPGEFTRRAFLNEKLDLTAVEGLADLIHAETDAQRRQAFRQMNGELHQLYSSWRERIIKILAYTEAFIDFSEDEQLEEDALNKARKEVINLIEEMEGHLRDNRRGERLRSGVRIVIVGRPNVGKSTLLNYICQKPLAIVSPIPGTTRDVVESCINFGGFPIVISDTAGIRDTDDAIEQEGVKRALQKFQLADIVILLMEPTSINNELKCDTLHDLVMENLSGLGFEDVLKYLSPFTYLQHSPESSTLEKVPVIMTVINKMDQGNECLPNYIINRTDFSVLKISCLTGYGINDFMDQLKLNVSALCQKSTQEPLGLTQHRHRHLLNLCVSNLKSYTDEYENDVVMAAYALRKSAEQLSKISGDITSEQILDIIFRDFCIGK